MYNYTKSNIKYVHLINRTITIKFMKPEFDVDFIEITFIDSKTAHFHLLILKDKYDLIETDRINMFVVKE